MSCFSEVKMVVIWTSLLKKIDYKSESQRSFSKTERGSSDISFGIRASWKITPTFVSDKNLFIIAFGLDFTF